jgi:2-iminobutanoate/2-iminopropanoate deaminase
MKQEVRTENAHPPIGPYSQGIRWERLIFTASVPTTNPQFGAAPEGDVRAMARNALENLKAIVEAGGSSLDNVLKVTLYIGDMKDFAAINEVYSEYFTSEPRPVRSLVRVASGQSSVSFDCIAGVPD